MRVRQSYIPTKYQKPCKGYSQCNTIENVRFFYTKQKNRAKSNTIRNLGRKLRVFSIQYNAENYYIHVEERHSVYT